MKIQILCQLSPLTTKGRKYNPIVQSSQAEFSPSLHRDVKRSLLPSKKLHTENTSDWYY